MLMKSFRKPFQAFRQHNLVLRMVAVLLGIAALFVVVGNLRPAWGAASDPTVFVNDAPWYSDFVMGAYMIYTDLYVPVSMFKSLDGYDVRENKTLKNVMISYGTHYMTFDTESNYVYTDAGDRYHLTTYALHNKERYVPLHTVCEYFGLTYESKLIDEKDEKYVVRVCDETANKTFNELLKKYNPSYADMETETTPPETEPPDTKPPLPVEKERVIYLTLEYPASDETDFDAEETVNYYYEILDILSAYGFEACFFFPSEDIVTLTGEIAAALAASQTIGLRASTTREKTFAQDIDNFVYAAETGNQQLYAALKIRTRLLRAPSGSYARRFHISRAEGQMIAEHGYVIWDWTCDLTPQGAGTSQTKKLLASASAGIEYCPVSVLRLRVDAVCTEILPMLAEMITENDYYTVLPLTDGAEEINLIQ